MKELYYGSLPAAAMDEGMRELTAIREGLRAFAPSQVVWDFGDPGKPPPWGGILFARGSPACPTIS